MGAGARPLLALLLLLLLLLLPGPAEPEGRAAGRKVLPPPSSLHYSFGRLCKLKWTWSPPEGISSDCDLKYCSEFQINGGQEENREWTKNLLREADVSLNKEVHFKVRSECKSDNKTEPSDWVEISTAPKGAAGTDAVDINCTWHNLEYMSCTWLPGQNASARTNYTLYYWYEGLGNPEQCQANIFEDHFKCIFKLSIPDATEMYPTISILIKGDSEDIRPVCANRNPTTIVKPGPPRNITVSKINNGLKIDWQNPGTFPPNCLIYEVELKDRKSNSSRKFEYKHLTSTTVPSVEPDAMYAIKVKAKPERTCYNSDLWSDWSEEKSFGEKTGSTFYTVLMLIPLTVAVATIILLVYLKRLKILIYPQIPDPRKIIKRMFGEQNEDSQNWPGDDFLNIYIPVKEEEIHSLVWIETSESSISENKDQKSPALQVKAI